MITRGGKQSRMTLAVAGRRLVEAQAIVDAALAAASTIQSLVRALSRGLQKQW